MSIKNGFYLQISMQFQPQNIYPGISRDISKKIDVVPLWMEKDNYCIGTADTSFDQVEEIERIIKKPVFPYLLTFEQFQSLQCQLYENEKPVLPAIHTEEIQNVLHSGEKRIVDLAQEQQSLQNLNSEENMHLEILGVQYQIPHIDLNMVVVEKELAVLIPLREAERRQVIPLWWIGNRLYLGCNSSALPDDISNLRSNFPFEVQLVLCDEKQWKKNYRMIYLDGEESKPITNKDKITFLQKLFLLDSSDLQRANIYSNQYHTDRITALLDLKIISPEMLLEAESLLIKMPILDVEQKPQNEWAEKLPSGIAQQLKIIAFDETDSTISITGNDLSKEKIELVQALTHKKVKPYLIDRKKLQIWLEMLYPSEKPQTVAYRFVPLKEILLTLGFITEEQIREAAGVDDIEDQRLSELLLERGYLSDNDLAIAKSIQTDLPYVLLEQAIFQEKLLNEFPKELVEKFQMIPLILKENSAWVATSDPFNGEGFHELRKKLKKWIVPVIAPKNVLRAIIEQNWAAKNQGVPDKVHQYIQKLIHADYLTQSQAYQMIQLMDTSELPFDKAFIQAGYYETHQAYQILASIFDVRTFNINLIEEQVEQFDGLGNKITRTIYNDPVNLGVAGMIDLATANKYCMLPIRKEDQQIIVAFADPLHIQNLGHFKKRFPLPIQPVLVIRTDLEDAIARTLGHKNIGTYLLEKSYITRHQLNDALELSKKTGVRLGQALLIKQYIQEDQMYEILAQQAKLRFVDLESLSIPEDIARLIDPEIEREFGILPIKITKTNLTLAIVDPFDEKGIEKAHEITGKKIQPVVASEANLEKALERIYHGDYTTISTSNLLNRSPKESAFHVLSTGQTIFFSALLALSLIMMILNFTTFVILANELITIFYIGFSAYKFYLVYNAMNHDCEVPVSQEEIDALDPRELPVYTLLIPVYKEAGVLPELMKSLTYLDYPSTKLDIKILLEEDDKETIQRFYDLNLPPHFRATIVPGSLPKTKPKACNYGLIHARGEYVVIFDAEDRPDSDQLKKAVVAFQKSNSNVVCIQAKLNYYNRRQNLLTQWFTSEYSMWFDLFLPGLDASDAPIPLGGTSNHFKRRALVEVGAWDPHNVTEDADLGMRLYKRGFHTRTIDSTTYEEANSRLNNWLRQRSRWIKGYIQTWLVHMRNPAKLLKEVGLKGFISFQFVIGGTFFAALVNPILWTITTVWYLTRWAFIQETFPGFIFYLSSLSLYLGNFVFTYMNVAGAMRRRHYDNVRFALLSPIYWGLMSVGAWKGFLQLMTKPHYWEKTIHGFSQGFEEEEGQSKTKEDGSHAS